MERGALVISRKAGEGFRIGDGVEVLVTAVRGGTVKLVVRAPKDVKVLRTELAEREAA